MLSKWFPVVLTIVGVKGAGTCCCSKAFQSVLLKKLWCLMFPLVPSRSSGSLTNSWGTNAQRFSHRAPRAICMHLMNIQETVRISFINLKTRSLLSFLPAWSYLNWPLKHLSDLDEYVLCSFAEPVGINGGVCPYGLKQLLFIAAVERRLTDQHLVQQHSEWPPVHRAVVLLTQQDLIHKDHTNW